METPGTSQAIDEQFHISPDAVNSDEAMHILNRSNTFGLFDRWGDILPQGPMAQGIYHQGTRFLNQLELTINGLRPVLLSSSIKEDNDILSVDLTNPVLKECNIPENTIHIFRNQFVREGSFHEKINVHHYGESDCSFVLTLSFSADFKDIFEIRGLKRLRKSNDIKVSSMTENKVAVEYLGLDNLARKNVITLETSVDYSLESNKASFSIKLAPYESVNIHYCMKFLLGEEREVDVDYQSAKADARDSRKQNQGLFAEVSLDNEQFNHWLFRSQIDLISLLATTETGLYPYAGVPWYNTTFGRDGIITAMETLWLAPEISKNVLIYLAATQAKELIPEKDAEPGKIIHEARAGEMANTGEIPFKLYYGTIDATPLFIMLAGMYYERTADLGLLRSLWPNIKAALNWIEEYGDIDGDGFVEYIHKAENGLTNQGWKDSFDAVMYENAELASPPIALCEVQGYVYGAKKYAASIAKELGEEQYADQLLREAEELKKKFNERFWDEDSGYFVLALDGKKQPCKVISSNPGHCLFTKIVDDSKARAVADRLLSPEMFSGWGIRTLSSEEKKYNPMSYHNGSIWPHDNALIAYGLSLYGFQEHVLSIVNALFDASLFTELQRLPELYCGFNRRSDEGPTEYPVACSPQAWSVAVVFMLLQACFNLKINAVEKTITFDNARLPEYMEFVYVNKLSLNGGFCDLQMKRLGTDVAFYVLQKPEGWDIVIKK